jgi:hypothetical protein
MKYNEMEITDKDWLSSVQDARHLTIKHLENVGVPIRYLDIDNREERKCPFENRLLLSKDQDKAKEILTDYIWCGLDICVPGSTILAIGFSELCDILTDYSDRTSGKALYKADALFVYDFGLFHLKDFQRTAIMKLFIYRYNNAKHIAMGVGGITIVNLVKHIGDVLFQSISNYCKCMVCDD